MTPTKEQEQRGRRVLFSELLDSTKELVTSTFKISPEQVRISEKVLSEFKINHLPLEDKKVSNRGLDQLLLEMLVRFPNYKPMQIWRALKADCYRAERIYDIDEILEEVSYTELIWTDRKGASLSLK